MKSLLIAALLLAACRHESHSSSETTTATLAVLEKADLADGTADKVVGMCITCGLGMPGSPDHVVEAEGYEFRLCSDKCVGKFEADKEKYISG